MIVVFLFGTSGGIHIVVDNFNRIYFKEFENSEIHSPFN